MIPDLILVRTLPASNILESRRRLRRSLYNFDLRITTAETEEVLEIAEGQAYLNALQAYFGIELEESYDAIRAIGG